MKFVPSKSNPIRAIAIHFHVPVDVAMLWADMYMERHGTNPKSNYWHNWAAYELGKLFGLNNPVMREFDNMIRDVMQHRLGKPDEWAAMMTAREW